MSNTTGPLKLKRGLEENRKNITPAEGELIYTIDEKRLYIGDGFTPGGLLVNPFVAKEWTFISVIDQTEYTLPEDETAFPSSENGFYLVFYGAVKLISTDYTISERSFTLTNAPEEENIPISIHYFGL